MTTRRGSWVTTSRSRPFMTHEKHSTQTTPTNGPCTPTRALGRPVARGRSPGRMPSGYAAPGDAVPVAAPVRARPSPGGHILQQLAKSSRRRKAFDAQSGPRGAVPRAVALRAMAGDVPAHKTGAEWAGEKASSVRQRGLQEVSDWRPEGRHGNEMGPGHGDKESCE